MLYRMKSNLILSAFLVLWVGACAPLLNSFPDGVQETFRSIKIETIPDRSGQYLKLRLEKILAPKGTQRCAYRLKTELKRTETLLGMGKDATTTRIRLTMSATYTLLSLRTGKELTSCTLKAHSSYNYLTEGFYSNTVSQQAAERAALDVLSTLISLELARYFSSECAKIGKNDVSSHERKPQAL